MTYEQIKQNAVAYADKAAPITEQNKGIPLAIHTAAEVAYIAGAHSRDREIAYLTYRLNDTTEKLQTVIAVRDNLRNPWISVEERLPKDKQKTLWIRSDGNMFLGEFHKHESGGLYFTSTDAVSDARLKGVTHWMPIPELKKGGEK